MFCKTYSSILENIDMELKANDNVLEIRNRYWIDILFYFAQSVIDYCNRSISRDDSYRKAKARKNNIRNIDFQFKIHII